MNEQRVVDQTLLRKFLKFWSIVEAVSAMSKDPSTQVGAIALDNSFNIVATAYNGFPRGVSDDTARYEDRETKLKLIAHAEQNLVAQAAYSGHSLRGCTVLVSALYPCSSCARSLIQSGVTRVISPPPEANPRWADDAKWSKILLHEASVEVIHVRKIIGPNGKSLWEIDSSSP